MYTLVNIEYIDLRSFAAISSQSSLIVLLCKTSQSKTQTVQKHSYAASLYRSHEQRNLNLIDYDVTYWNDAKEQNTLNDKTGCMSSPTTYTTNQ